MKDETITIVHLRNILIFALTIVGFTSVFFAGFAYRLPIGVRSLLDFYSFSQQATRIFLSLTISAAVARVAVFALDLAIYIFARMPIKKQSHILRRTRIIVAKGMKEQRFEIVIMFTLVTFSLTYTSASVFFDTGFIFHAVFLILVFSTYRLSKSNISLLSTLDKKRREGRTQLLFSPFKDVGAKTLGIPTIYVVLVALFVFGFGSAAKDAMLLSPDMQVQVTNFEQNSIEYLFLFTSTGSITYSVPANNFCIDDLVFHLRPHNTISFTEVVDFPDLNDCR